jgi:hypothetical protein
MSRTDRVLIGVLVGCVGVWGTAAALPAAAWLAVVSVLLGGAITACFAWYFYWHSAKDLKDEAAALRLETERVRNYIDALISYQEAKGVIKVVRDEQGRPIRTQILRLEGIPPPDASELSGSFTLTQEDPPTNSERDRED